jgi:hypothetical protein
VLLDLMVIKTVASFTARPMLWFSLLATPLALIGVFALIYSLWSWAAVTDKIALPVAGSGLIFLLAAFILGLAGVLGELVYKLGDMREHEFSRLTAHVWSNSGRASVRKVERHA